MRRSRSGQTPLRVLVVGGGLTGAIATHRLSQLGFAVEVWEMACGHQVSKRAFILALAQTGGVKREKAVKWVSQNPNAGGERGVSMLLEELKSLSSGEATKGVDNLAQVIGARRQQGESVGAYVDRFLMMVSDLEETGEGNSLQESEAGRLALCVMMLKGSG